MASVPNEKPAWPPGQQPQHVEEYAMAEDAPQPAAAPSSPGGPPGSQRAIWYYVPRATGKREGPVTIEVLKQRFAAGGLSAEDLVWREGMAEWVPARAAPELLMSRPAQGGPPPFPSAPTAPQKPVQSGPSAAELLEQAQGFFARPMLYRMIGLAGGGLCLVWLFFAIVAWAFSGGPAALACLDGAFILAMLFVLGNGIAAILEKLDRE
jgi:hypothetical protein